MKSKQILEDIGLTGVKHNILGSKALLKALYGKDGFGVINSITVMAQCMRNIASPEDPELIALMANVWSMDTFELLATVALVSDAIKEE